MNHEQIRQRKPIACDVDTFCVHLTVEERDSLLDEVEVAMGLIDKQRERAEQAERERDAWMTPFDGSGIEWHESLPSPYTYQASDFSKLVAAVHEYEARAQQAEWRYEALARQSREAIRLGVRQREQAERERDECHETFKRNLRLATEDYRAQLAAVPALVEALRELANERHWEVGAPYQTDGRYRFIAPATSNVATPWAFAREALTAYEQAERERDELRIRADLWKNYAETK